MREAAVVLSLTTLWAGLLAAQDSQFGLRGLGQPGRPLSARARATGGAFAAFDAGSAVNPAAVARVRLLTASAAIATSNRRFEGAGTKASLRTTRFPVGSLTAPFFFGNTFAIRLGTYLDRSYDVITADTVVVRGESIAVSDDFRSDGGVSDLALVLSRRLRPNLDVGVALHGLVGSTRVRVARTFGDERYASYVETEVERYSGLGTSVGAVYVPVEGLAIGAYWRSDRNLSTSVEERETMETDLPHTVGAGVTALVGTELRVAAAVEWRDWSVARTAARSFGTVEGAVGAELGPERRVFRLGIRYAQLPFGPVEQPTEVDLSAGLGFNFSQGRGTIDVALERAWRSGDRATERLWTLVVGLTVRP